MGNRRRRLRVDFNPRSPYGERPDSAGAQSTEPVDFNPRSPYGERLIKIAIPISKPRFQSTLPLRGATRQGNEALPFPSISIHAPLTGSDWERSKKYGTRMISIHAPLTGSDARNSLLSDVSGYFNPRSPYGERLLCPGSAKSGGNFNPRSPYGERQLRQHPQRLDPKFQSTLPLRGATIQRQKNPQRTVISIHAPLTGSDTNATIITSNNTDFNPRSPYGERPRKYRYSHPGRDFNPRSPYGERLIFLPTLSF